MTTSVLAGTDARLSNASCCQRCSTFALVSGDIATWTDVRRVQDAVVRWCHAEASRGHTHDTCTVFFFISCKGLSDVKGDVYSHPIANTATPVQAP